MCQLFGITSDKLYCANGVLARFFENSVLHKDGWGIAVFDGDKMNMEKEPLKAIDSKLLREILSEDITCKDMLAHIRRASVGQIEYVNCHRFVFEDISGRTWTLIHNGTIFEPEMIQRFFEVQQGTTDSEAMGLLIVDSINKEIERSGHSLSDKERFNVIDKILFSLSPSNKLNMILYDGELMYVHTNMKGTLFELFSDGTRIFATEPLTDENWTNVKLNTLQAYKNGEQVFEGTDHGNEYFQDGQEIVLRTYGKEFAK